MFDMFRVEIFHRLARIVIPHNTTDWLVSTTEMYFVTVLEAGSPKGQVPAGFISSEAALLGLGMSRPCSPCGFL